MHPLAQKNCQPLEGHPALTAPEVTQHLSAAPGWVLAGDAIERSFEFPDFHRTMAFVNAVAWVAHVQDHHPSMQVAYNHCTLRFNTHSVAGISINDFICAAKADALLCSRPP